MKQKRFLKLSDLKESRPGFCRWCGVEVEPPKVHWCSKTCVNAYMLESRGNALRRAVYKRDKGICAECGLDLKPLQKRWKKADDEERQLLMEEYKIPPHRKTLWDADHKVRIVDKGARGISNARLLCLWCHASKTAKERATNF